MKINFILFQSCNPHWVSHLEITYLSDLNPNHSGWAGKMIKSTHSSKQFFVEFSFILFFVLFLAAPQSMRDLSFALSPLSGSPALQVDSLPAELPGKPILEAHSLNHCIRKEVPKQCFFLIIEKNTSKTSLSTSWSF